MDVYSTELGIRLSFVKTSEFRGGGGLIPPNPLGTSLVRIALQTLYTTVIKTKYLMIYKARYVQNTQSKASTM
jgi:hypothetical protein